MHAVLSSAELRRTRRRELRRSAALLYAVCLFGIVSASGCNTSLRQWAGNGFKVGPNYATPGAPVESAWIDFQRDPRLSEQPPELGAWWTVFRDERLDGLIAAASQQNLTLRTAGTRILQAQAIRNIAAGSFFPQVQQGVGSYNRVQLSRNTANAAPIKNFDQWDAGFNVSWELDFWGRFRRGIESADAGLEASVASYDNVLVLLLADVASSYVQIRTLQEELRLLHENVRLQKESLAIANAQFKAGAADETDVLQLRNNVEQTEAIIPALEAALRQESNALCILLGEPPRDISVELGVGPIPTAPSDVAVGIPADLLRQRPDVRQAERIVAAESAQIGVAESELYPHIAINGVLSWQADSSNRLFAPGSEGGSIGPGFAWNILNYGRLTNAVRKQQAAFEQSVFEYQDTVLKAQREAENAIVGFLKAQDQAAKLNSAVADISKLNSLLLIQANAGARDFNRVYVVQAQMTAQQDNLATTQGSIAQNLIRIYRSLGGGWQFRPDCFPRQNAQGILTPAGPPLEQVPPPQPQNLPAP